jgi:hypothetical protein
MTKTLLLGAAAALVLSAGGASAATHPAMAVKAAPGHVHLFPGKKGAKTLYDQTNNDSGIGIVSSDFDSGSFDSYDNRAADDFTVPKGQTWTVTEVDAVGSYFNGSGTASGPADSENVIFYADSKGKPGKAVKGGTFTKLKGKDTSGSFAMTLGKKGVVLPAGTYWVSVQASIDFSGTNSEWAWSNQSTSEGKMAMWENPGNGFGTGCTKYTVENTCIADGQGDHEFVIKGTSKKGK